MAGKDMSLILFRLLMCEASFSVKARLNVHHFLYSNNKAGISDSGITGGTDFVSVLSYQVGLNLLSFYTVLVGLYSMLSHHHIACFMG